MLNALAYSQQLLDKLVNKYYDGNFIDGTTGNGNDIHRIVSNKHFKGHAYGFDIQEQAILNTQNKLEDIDSNRYTLINDSHANINKYIKSNVTIHGAIFNLGYLPGGDHSITTQGESTLKSVEFISNQLVKGGQIILVVYSGHDSGKVESDQILNALSEYSQDEFQVLTYQFINQINHPPYVIIIERK
ncbi:class I SAM-dependent methyltransferase [Aerococcaceae bacterium DSM 111176]|nr:class I SAM-dependent methyltransferase [Aerococcaceae bacterium DSM 111176]